MIWLNKTIKIFMSIIFAIAVTAVVLLLLYLGSKIEWLLPLIMLIIVTVILAKNIYTWFD